MPTANPEHSPILIHHHPENVWQAALAPSMARAAVSRHLQQWERITEEAPRIIVDMRRKGFEQLDAQKLFSTESRTRMRRLAPSRLALVASGEAVTFELEAAGQSEVARLCATSADAWQWLGAGAVTPDICLIAGATGAGKSTFARWLATELQAVWYATDQWMTTLFRPDLPPAHGYEWFWERVQRIEKQACSIAAQHAERHPAILDFGLDRFPHNTLTEAR